jgi:hypothetical protein
MDVHEFVRNWAVELKDSPEVEMQARLFYLKALAKSGPRKARLLLFDWLMQVRAECVEKMGT